MSRRALARSLTLPLGLVVLCLLVYPRTASADSVDMTLVANAAVLPEGSSFVFTAGIANLTGATIYGTGPGGVFTMSLTPATTSGDMSDVLDLVNSISSGVFSSTCLTTTSLAPGYSCGFILTVLTASPAGETDIDSGTVILVGNVDYLCPNCTGGASQSAQASIQVTVADPVATPEPSSLLLLGTGLLGLGPLLRRRFARF